MFFTLINLDDDMKCDEQFEEKLPNKYFSKYISTTMRGTCEIE